MAVNYNVQNIIVDNLKEFETRLIIEFDNAIPYIKYIENEKNGWFELLEKTAKDVFPIIEELIKKYYRDIELPFFTRKNTDIPNFMDNSESHRTLLFDIKIDLEYRINQLLRYSDDNEQLKQLLDVYIDLLEKICIYYDKIHLYQCNYVYCQLILDKEIKNKTNSTTKELVSKNLDAETGIDIDLLNYFSDNFKGGKTPLTKYNQIYRYFNEDRDVNIPHRAHKNRIRELFGFDYGNSDITREIKNHLNTLKNLAVYYRDSKK